MGDLFCVFYRGSRIIQTALTWQNLYIIDSIRHGSGIAFHCRKPLRQDLAVGMQIQSDVEAIGQTVCVKLRWCLRALQATALTDI